MASDLVAMISEVNFAGSNTKEWWTETSATRHVCLEKSLFSSFKEVNNGAKLFMGNSITADIQGEGDVILKCTSRKELKLKNVLYVPEIQKNLVPGWLLNKYGFCLAFELDLIVKENNLSKMNTNSTCVVETLNVWHGRLGQDNYNSIRRVFKLN